MSRSKKSRKPGGAPTAKPKLSKVELEKVDKRTRKSTGKVAGNRQKEAAPLRNDKSQATTKKDPRLGSKTPIDLGKIVSKVEKSRQEVAKKEQTLAAVRYVEKPETEIITPEQELENIEQDQALLTIIAKQEDEIELSEQEVDYYNEKIGRYEELSAELGVIHSEEKEEPSVQATEEDLWNKLDGHDFSDFEEKE